MCRGVAVAAKLAAAHISGAVRDARPAGFWLRQSQKCGRQKYVHYCFGTTIFNNFLHHAAPPAPLAQEV